MKLKKVGELNYKVRYRNMHDRMKFFLFIACMKGKWKIKDSMHVYRDDGPVANKCRLEWEYAFIRLLDRDAEKEFIESFKKEFECKDDKSKQ